MSQLRHLAQREREREGEGGGESFCRVEHSFRSDSVQNQNKNPKMGEGGADSSSLQSQSQSFLKRHWEEYKEFWGERFSVLDNYSKFIKRDQPLPSWSSDDVDEFVSSDPVHGPTLRTVREAAKFGAAGSVIGAVSTAAMAWKYSRSPHGAALSFGAGAVFGWTFGQEIANHWLQLYRLDTMAAQVKFLEWWEKKSAGRA